MGKKRDKESYGKEIILFFLTANFYFLGFERFKYGKNGFFKKFLMREKAGKGLNIKNLLVIKQKDDEKGC